MTELRGTRGPRPGRAGVRASVAAVVLAAALAVGTALGLVAAAMTPPSQPGPVAAAPTPDAATPSIAPSPTPTRRPTPRPTPSPTPTPLAALTALPVSAAAAQQHVIAVMVDDLAPARPQAGFNSASVVWHAPAEGGVPRYMLLFQERIPGLVGPVRSVRQYYIAWASEWRSLMVHVGGSPQALRTLRQDGQGELVWDADEFRWGGTYLWRAKDRFAPHNVYTDGAHLRKLAKRLGAKDGPLEAVWRFGPELPIERRPTGAALEVPYRYNVVRYGYDRERNRYVRSVVGASPQVDAADGQVVAPRNVVVLFVDFRPLNDGHPEKQRLEARVVGTGRALVATNGVTIEGTWRKDGLTDPTLILDGRGHAIPLVPGQTFVQVVPKGTRVKVAPGQPLPAPAPIAADPR